MYWFVVDETLGLKCYRAEEDSVSCFLAHPNQCLLSRQLVQSEMKNMRTSCTSLLSCLELYAGECTRLNLLGPVVHPGDFSPFSRGLLM